MSKYSGFLWTITTTTMADRQITLPLAHAHRVTISYAQNSRLKVSVSSPPQESELFSIICIEAVT